ncbi:hypothetical protein GYMLUDRAFT_65015 [Collybiopsis luxurians FD-317 M1]|uniref:Uncharacterized protein n=1 Tax=Collybiopsis luxurians FD-317 M1 TaxID=944289 RepID=A0A0D0ALM6_9AGAR|nr:hypothetical protein GYMLUDRAFT_65015 [Collybiopsis luxurians FD-317 M1]
MDPSSVEGHDSTAEASQMDNNPLWYQKHTFDFYQYEVDEDSFVQTIFQPPTALEDNTPMFIKVSSPVTFEVHTGAAPKYSHTAKVKYRNQEYGLTALQSSGFGAQGTKGNSYWYYHQSSQDLDSPLPVPPPKAEGMIFLHRNLTDHQYQLWMWVNKNGLPPQGSTKGIEAD